MSWNDLNMLNFYRRASADWRLRNRVSLETGKVTSTQYADWESSWDYICNDPKRRGFCDKFQDFFNMYRVVPPFCINCWKVVVKPRKHSELIKLRNIMREMATDDSTVWCKCGSDHRPYVPGLYGGYFYNDSKETGLKRLQQVRERLWDVLKQDGTPAYLKRYCTEFEQALGDSAKYVMPEYAEDAERFYIANLEEDARGNRRHWYDRTRDAQILLYCGRSCPVGDRRN